MAKVVITFEDKPDGGIGVIIESNADLSEAARAKPMTNAQSAAMALLDGLREIVGNDGVKEVHSDF